MDKQRSEESLGFSWEPTDIPLPHENTKNMPGLALFMFQKNRVGIVWNSLGVFENNPATLPQTETILQGQSVGGISIDQLSQVKRFGDGSSYLIDALKGKKFALDTEFAKHVHAIVGREEALQWGVLRSQQVHIHGVEHVPPKADALPALAEKGFAYLREQLTNPTERAIATFLFMSRTQFFFDCNKRTALLMMNGVLLSEGYYPITVLKETAEEFNEKLRVFYNSGDATEMFTYFSHVSLTLYAKSE